MFSGMVAVICPAGESFCAITGRQPLGEQPSILTQIRRGQPQPHELYTTQTLDIFILSFEGPSLNSSYRGVW